MTFKNKQICTKRDYTSNHFVDSLTKEKEMYYLNQINILNFFCKRIFLALFFTETTCKCFLRHDADN